MPSLHSHLLKQGAELLSDTVTRTILHNRQLLGHYGLSSSLANQEHNIHVSVLIILPKIFALMNFFT